MTHNLMSSTYHQRRHPILVPTLCVGMHTGREKGTDVEEALALPRPHALRGDAYGTLFGWGLHSHAERGNEKTNWLSWKGRWTSIWRSWAMTHNLMSATYHQHFISALHLILVPTLRVYSGLIKLEGIIA